MYHIHIYIYIYISTFYAFIQKCQLTLKKIFFKEAHILVCSKTFFIDCVLTKSGKTISSLNN